MKGRTAQTRHSQTNTVSLELKANTARSSTMLLYTLKEPGEAPFIGTGFYLDVWRKADAGWRIARRTATLDP
jgi:3-phenylpropionate/cinnamic acid dioxygenase small subunit